ncbi:hypothetical protein PLESTB_000221700 [Pleodorina starrii]|uniref:Sensitive to high expression protein 9, mitochondrial n=1 Tax=Pleodorina starrii TaxID=330485 RepID=A0A9W6BD59_9CHLO|nr:hypothetical protein PLESTM_001547500 [Pleodorina starrii]GLC49462.1 hypothetical protein PLESTB_000221700 [Pleodorina starrii]GLC75696.1 hypothetical protein PLESTF_001674800 [Pleodorina starrii]
MSTEMHHAFAWTGRHARQLALMLPRAALAGHPAGAAIALCSPIAGTLSSSSAGAPILSSLASISGFARCDPRKTAAAAAHSAPAPTLSPKQRRSLLLTGCPPHPREDVLCAAAHQTLAILHHRTGFGHFAGAAAGFSSSSHTKDSAARPDSSPSPSTHTHSNETTTTTTTTTAPGHAASPSGSSPSHASSSSSPPSSPYVPHPTPATGTANGADSTATASAETPQAATPSAVPASPPAAAPAPSPVGPGPPPAASPAGPGAVLVLRARSGSARASLDRASASLLAAAADLGAKLNRVTGYDNIERLKVKVDEATRRLADAREELREGKLAFEALVAEQGDVQRQQMSLLQRKSSWGAADLERFTELCRQEHHLEAEVAQAKAAYGEAAEALESCHDQVAAAVRERYSAETLWSDKIRRASTWWTAGLMALHLVSFMSVYLVMEPIKARRLRNHVEEVLRLEMNNVRQSLASLEASLHPQRAAAGGSSLAAAAAVTAAAVTNAPGPGAVADRAEGAAIPVAGVDSVSELLEQVRQVRAHVAAMEAGLVGVLEQGGGLRTAEPSALPPPQSPALPSPRDAWPQGVCPEEGMQSGSTAVLEPEKGQGWTSGARAWRLWLAEQVHRIAARPEFTTAASAFAGAALGVGLLLAFRDR